MAVPRAQQVDPEATPYYHCISRCVRRAFLCGADRYSGRSFDHRKGWLVERLHKLAALFAIDVCAYGVMSNHFHLVLRIDRARALAWSEAEVRARARRLWPGVVRAAEKLPEAARRRLEVQWRERLWNLSWFMRSLNEYIARQANAEDNCTGRFWEGRFRSQALLDEGALLTCMTYVDLNPIRAGLAETLEASEFTSIRARLWAAAQALAAEAGGAEDLPAAPRAALVPFADEVSAPSPTLTGAAPPLCLPIARADYVVLLESTAAAVRAERDATLPPALAPALARVGLDPAGFIPAVRHFARSFFGMVGEVHRIDTESRRRGYRRRLGLPAAQRLYRRPAA